MPSKMEDVKRFIGKLKEAGVFKLEDVKLKSGQISPIYIDFRGLISTPALLQDAVHMLWSKVDSLNLKYDNLCGVPYAALPLAAGICLEQSIPMLMRRKEMKDYGTKRMIEGKYRSGDTCLIIEDVVTSGASISETAKLLREHELCVEDCVILLDRQQGGQANLVEDNITVHSVLTMDQVLEYLVETGEISGERKKDIQEVLSPKRSNQFLKEQNTNVVAHPSIEQRLESGNMHPQAKRLCEIMLKKNTNLCFSADFGNTSDILQVRALPAIGKGCRLEICLRDPIFATQNHHIIIPPLLPITFEAVRNVGSHICLLKLHADSISDFSDKFIENLKNLAAEKEFLIMEDRKFSDTGNTVNNQLRSSIFKTPTWANLITAHTVSGPGVLEGLKQGCEEEKMGVVLVAEMSSEGNLTTDSYKSNSVAMAEKYPDIVCGFVCQKKCSTNNNFLFMSPGVSMSSKGDGLGQQFRSPCEAITRDNNDILIVGRGIMNSEDMERTAEMYKNKGWEALRGKC